jgi:hypothetical protein
MATNFVSPFVRDDEDEEDDEDEDEDEDEDDSSKAKASASAYDKKAGKQALKGPPTQAYDKASYGLRKIKKVSPYVLMEKAKMHRLKKLGQPGLSEEKETYEKDGFTVGDDDESTDEAYEDSAAETSSQEWTEEDENEEEKEDGEEEEEESYDEETDEDDEDDGEQWEGFDD